MSPQESCAAVEAKIRELPLLLRPDTLDQCQAELEGIAVSLQTLVSAGISSAEAELLHRIRRSAARLRIQVDYASNFWSGLLQMRLGAGYTSQGFPVFLSEEARSLCDG